jgi:membrane protein
MRCGPNSKTCRADDRLQPRARPVDALKVDFTALQGRAWSTVPARLREPLHVAIDAVNRWMDVSGLALGASIAFYTMFALAPLLVITIAIAGAVFGPEAARGEIVSQLVGVVGPVAGRAIESMITSAWREPGGLLATVIGTATLLVGASGVFTELRRALNAMGRIAPRPTTLSTFLRFRLTAFALLLGFGFLAIASLVLSAVVAGVTGFLSSRYAALGVLARLLEFGLSTAVLTVAFAALLRWLPDRPPGRRATWLSAFTSSVLFAVGKSLIGLYLGRASVTSTYGAAGSFVVLMLWVYYSSQILLYGAAVGRVYDERRAAADRTPAP